MQLMRQLISVYTYTVRCTIVQISGLGILREQIPNLFRWRTNRRRRRGSVNHRRRRRTMGYDYRGIVLRWRRQVLLHHRRLQGRRQIFERRRLSRLWRQVLHRRRQERQAVALLRLLGRRQVDCVRLESRLIDRGWRGWGRRRGAGWGRG